jgi:hypothetical protein
MTSKNVSSADNQQERFLENEHNGNSYSFNSFASIPNQLGYYLAGFVDGEGSFNVSLRRNSDYRVNWQVVMSFNVSQKEKLLLLVLKKYLGCGIVKTRKRDGLHSYDVTKPNDVIKRVIPFFERFKILSKNKRRNFEIFKNISVLMNDQKHLHPEGLYEILLLRERLNEGKGRKRKYSIYDVFPKKSPETIRQDLLKIDMI